MCQIKNFKKIVNHNYKKSEKTHTTRTTKNQKRLTQLDKNYARLALLHIKRRIAPKCKIL